MTLAPEMTGAVVSAAGGGGRRRCSGPPRGRRFRRARVRRRPPPGCGCRCVTLVQFPRRRERLDESTAPELGVGLENRRVPAPPAASPPAGGRPAGCLAEPGDEKPFGRWTLRSARTLQGGIEDALDSGNREFRGAAGDHRAGRRHRMPIDPEVGLDCFARLDVDGAEDVEHAAVENLTVGIVEAVAEPDRQRAGSVEGEVAGAGRRVADDQPAASGNERRRRRALRPRVRSRRRGNCRSCRRRRR